MPHFTAEQLYIKLDKKLIFQAKRINVTLSNNKSSDPIAFDTSSLSPILDIARKSFQLFTIDSLSINEYNATFSYTDNFLDVENNFLSIVSPDLSLHASYRMYKEHILLTIDESSHAPTLSTLEGKVLHDFTTRTSYSSLSLSIQEDIKLKLFIQFDDKKLGFTSSSNIFTDLSPAIKPLNFRYGLYRWIVPYNKAKSYQIMQAKGIYEFNNPDTIFETFYVYAHEKGLEYTFNEKLLPVIGTDADIYFTKGLLDVRPHGAHYSKHSIDKGGVSINFNDKDIILKVNLYTNITLDEEIVNILAAYDIDLPLLQENGTSKSHIEIVINLSTQKAYATGNFFISHSDLILDKVKYRIKNTSIRLHKNILNVDTADVGYQNIMQAHLSGQIDLKDLIGDFYFDLESVEFPISENKKLLLSNKDTRLQLHFDSLGESYIFPQTLWKFDDINITLEANEIKLAEKFSNVAYLKYLKFKINNFLEFSANGQYNILEKEGRVDINISKLSSINTDLNLSTSQLPLDLSLHYNNERMDISLLKPTHFVFNGIGMDIEATKMSIYKGYLDINNTQIIINKLMSTQVSTHYELGDNTVKLYALGTSILEKKILYIKDPFKILYHHVQGHHYIDIPKYKIHGLRNQEEIFELKFNDLSKLQGFSPLMQHYDIKKAKATVIIFDEKIGIDMDIQDFHPLLSKDGRDITEYKIQGSYENNLVNLRINKKIDLLYKTKAKVVAKDIDFNLRAILNYLERIKSKDTNTSIDILMKTQRCSVVIDNNGRKILSDTMDVQIKDTMITAQIIYQNGGVLFESEDNNMTIFARGLNDNFMNSLFKFSTFKGGSLSFTMQGPFDNMKGIMNIKNTVIEDYTVLNNTLAFFNTIPALMTFSIPNYSKKGLKVKQLYSSFYKKNDIIKISDTKLISKELTITAKGNSDLEKETIDLLMQVKTDLGSTAKHIPLFGYIIFGKDNISTIVRVHGDLKNPKVESSVAKSIVAAPYNIIKRTITLPFLPFLPFLKKDKPKIEPVSK
ncbi:AsmA-like C-terminal domain-containing protein [Sulfurimonas sp. MAG313]|nr:AsmA-like C-terminal domain-containing protein [Sulfurimonas sp. MAG313]